MTEPEAVTGEVVAYGQTSANATLALPSQSEFDRIMQQADIISRSGIVPTSYRTVFNSEGRAINDKRPNVVVAALTGRTFGWDILTAMRNIHVIEGAASLKPEAQLGMIRAQGHRVSISRGERSVTVTGRRGDTGDEMAASFSFEDGVRAGLCTLKDGQPHARSDRGKPLPWEQYPVDMCQWRAVAIVARGLFSDVVLGLGYTPEELGAIVDASGDVPADQIPDPAPRSSAPEPEVVEAELVSGLPAEAGVTFGPTAPKPADLTPEQHRDRARQHDQLKRGKAEPEAGTVEGDLHAAKVRREAVNGQRRGPYAAMGRALYAVQSVYPEWSRQDAIDEIELELGKLGTTKPQAKPEHYITLAEMWEAQEDDQIRARYEQRAGDAAGAGDTPPADPDGAGGGDQPGEGEAAG